jgi:hypothetical protein
MYQYAGENMKIGFYFGLAAVIVLMIVCIYIRFSAMLEARPDQVLEAWSDGYKAYETVLYHIRYDSTYSHYSGMNYPFGEHVVPADCQPVLSNTVKLLKPLFPSIDDYTMPMVHYSMILSFFLCGIFVYLIFSKWDVAPWYAVPAAVGITFLNPQTERMAGHFGLGHLAAVPMTLYLLLVWEEKPTLRTNLALAATVFVFSMLHFYFFAMLAFLIFFYLFFSYLLKPSRVKLIQSATAFTIQVLLPFVFFYIWMNYLDPVNDRSVSPEGFFDYKAYWEGLLLSEAQPWYSWIDQHISHIRRLNIENKSYLGLVAVVYALVVIARWLGAYFRKPAIQLNATYSHTTNAAFYAAFVILLFSLGLPFIIRGLEPLLAYTGPIRQFRSVGRFAWVFYYVINILAFTALFHLLKDKRTWTWIVGVCGLGFMLYEARNQTLSTKFDLWTIKECQPGHTFNDITGLTYSDYQTTLPIPYCNIGSEIPGFNQQGQVLQKVLLLSTQTSLPTAGAMLTRTSLSQTLKQLQLISEPYRIPAIFEDYPNDKPILMVWDERYAPPAATRYRHLLDGAKLVYRKDDELEPYGFYNLPLDSYHKRIEQRRDSIRNILQNDTLLHAIGPFRTTAPDTNFWYDAMDTETADKHYLGSGGKKLDLADKAFLFTGPMPSGVNRQVVSFWVYMNKDFIPRTELEIVEYGPDPVAPRMVRKVGDIIAAIDNNGWALVELPYQPNGPRNGVSISLKNYATSSGVLYVDELLIRPVDTNLYREDAEHLWWNNRVFEK